MAVHHLTDYRQPQPRAGHGSGRGGPVEPLEDQLPVFGRDTGAGVGNGQNRAIRLDLSQPYLHGPAGRTPLRRVVEHVEHGARQPGTLTEDKPGRHVDFEVDVAAPAADTLERAVHHLGEVDLFVHHLGRIFTCEIYEIAHERGEFFDLGHHVRSQLGHVRFGHRPRTRLARRDHQLQIRAQ